MKLPAVPVHDFEDATLDFEALESLQLLGARYGSLSQAMPAATAGTFTIAHGLSAAPSVAFAIPDGAAANDLTVGVTALNATSFTVTWRRTSGLNAPTPITWWWFATR